MYSIKLDKRVNDESEKCTYWKPRKLMPINKVLL